MKKSPSTIAFIFIFLFLTLCNAHSQVVVSGAVVGNGTYSNLTSAFAAINLGPQSGAIITVMVMDDVTEPSSGATLNAGLWTSLLIRPAAGQLWVKVKGAITPGNALVTLDGADRVTIDGKLPTLEFINTTVSSAANTSTIRFKKDACNNVIRRCFIGGAATMGITVPGGNVLFDGDAVATGSDFNVIDSCEFGTSSGNPPTKAIHFGGTTTSSALNNSSDTIRDCAIFNFFNEYEPSAGIYVTNGSTDIVIRNNRFFQKVPRTQLAGQLHAPVWIDNVNGNRFSVIDNRIGFNAYDTTGTYSFSGTIGTKFAGIYINSGSSAGTESSIQGNVIKNISMTGTDLSLGNLNAVFRGIHVAGGLANVGNLSGNVIGSETDSMSIYFSNGTTTNTELIGIFNSGTSLMTCNNNFIGGIYAVNSNTGQTVIMAIRSNPSSPMLDCSNNRIGGGLKNSIRNISSSGTSRVEGIHCFSPGSISGNVISNLTNTSGTGIELNASVIGISFNSTTGAHSIIQNKIHSLKNTNTSAATIVSGIYINGFSGAANSVSRNFIHTLMASSSTATINGIHFIGGTVTFANNMIRLGLDTAGGGINTGLSINGIYETSGQPEYYFNSIYIDGKPTGSSSNTFCVNSSITNSRKYRNNIFCNVRSNNGSTGKHYAVKIAGTVQDPVGLTMDHNLYYVTGTGGYTGLFSSADRLTLTDWQTASGQDSASRFSDPKFKMGTGSASKVDLHIQTNNITYVESRGVIIPGINTDYDGNDRSTLTPVDIGADAGNFKKHVYTLSMGVIIQGFYNMSTNLMTRDTITVCLINASAPYQILDSAKGFISNENGQQNFEFEKISTGTQFYIQIRHRNSIETWSKLPQVFTTDQLPYSFASNTNTAYGNNLVQVDASPLRYAIYGGDVNQDGYVNLNDLTQIYNSGAAFVSGYVPSDINYDNIVNLSDMLIAYNNAGAFVAVSRP